MTAVAPAPHAAIDEQNPWPGLGAFDEAAERFFNGREREIAELRRLVLNAPLTVMFGASGLGKTSLVQAGLFPVLRKDRILPVYLRLDVTDRGQPLIDQLKNALLIQLQKFGVDAPAFADGESLWHYLHRTGLEMWSRQNQMLTPLFVFDQFEEIFTLGATNQEAVAQMQSDLADLIENRLPADMARSIKESESASAELSLDSQRYKILLSFRSDYLPLVERWKRKMPSIMRNWFQLLQMTEDQAFEAVHTTAPQLATEEIAHKIVSFVAATQEKETGRTADSDDASEVYVEPALLSLVCHGLNEKRKAQGKPAFDEALLNTAAPSIISDYYSDALKDLPDCVEKFIEEELITERGFRKQCDIDDARSVHNITDAQLRTLVNRRLLRIDPQRGTERVELTHDLLTRVVRDRRDRRREAEHQRERTEREKAAAQAIWQRRRAFVFTILGVALAGLVVLFALMYSGARQQTRLAAASRLATIALLKKDTALDLASLLSLEARRTADTLETRNAVLTTFQTNLLTYLHHTSAVQAVAFSPNGSTLVSGSADGSLQLWDVPNRKALGGPMKPPADSTATGVSNIAVNFIAFSPDGKLIATAGEDKNVRLWDAASRTLVGKPLVLKDAVNSVAFNREGTILASTCDDKTIQLWDVASQQPLGEPLRGHEKEVLDAVFSPDGKMLASGSADKTIRFWDVATHQSMGEMMRGHDNIVLTVAFSPDGRTLASGGEDETVRLWDVGTRKAIGEPLRGHSSYVSSVAFSPDGKTLVSGSYDQTVRRWNMETRKPLGVGLRAHASYVYSVAFSPDGTTLASASFDKNVLLWDMTAPASGGQTLSGHNSFVYSVAFSPDGRTLASASNDRTVQFWNIAERKSSGTPMRGVRAFGSIAFSPDGRDLACAAVGGPIRLWYAASRRPWGSPIQATGGGVSSVTYVPDGALAFGTLDGYVRERDESGSILSSPKIGNVQVTAVAASPDGNLLASTTNDGLVRLWDTANLKQLSTLAGHEKAVRSAAFSPDSRMLATGGDDQTVRLWDVANKKQSGDALKGHSGPVTCVAFHPKGKLLGTGSEDLTVRLWEVDSHRTFGDPFLGHEGIVSSIAFSPDGAILASGSYDKTVRIWDMTVDSWQVRPCRVANRNLSLTEWHQYLGPKVPYRKTCPDLPPGDGAPNQ